MLILAFIGVVVEVIERMCGTVRKQQDANIRFINQGSIQFMKAEKPK